MSRPARTGELEASHLRYQSLADALRRAHVLLFALSLITILAIFALFWITVINRPEPTYFATDPRGRITPLTPVSEPYLTDPQVIQFAAEAVRSSLTITFSNFRDDLANARTYYEQPDGWNSFLDALEGSRLLQFIRTRKLNSSAVAQGAVITKRGTDKRNRHSWIVQVRVSVTYESSSETSRDNHIVELQLVRLPNWEVPSGIGVARIAVRPAGGP